MFCSTWQKYSYYNRKKLIKNPTLSLKVSKLALLLIWGIYWNSLAKK